MERRRVVCIKSGPWTTPRKLHKSSKIKFPLKDRRAWGKEAQKLNNQKVAYIVSMRRQALKHFSELHFNSSLKQNLKDMRWPWGVRLNVSVYYKIKMRCGGVLEWKCTDCRNTQTNIYRPLFFMLYLLCSPRGINKRANQICNLIKILHS